MLQIQEQPGSFTNLADAWGVTATGWSWSSKFGDLDQDGFLDSGYSVNGMMTASTFSHLPGYELVEENQVLRNNGNLAVFSSNLNGISIKSLVVAA